MVKIRGTVIVIGGSRGIGKAAALRIAELGYDVVLTWHSSQCRANDVVARISHIGRRALAMQLKLEVDSIKEKFCEIDQWLKQPIVGLVNNAAAAGGRRPFTQHSLESWERIFRVNVFSLSSLCIEAVERMAISKGGSGGSIVNLSSQVAMFGGNKLLPYAASKGAINSLTISLAKEIGHERIRVNAVSPGLIETFGDSSLREEQHQKINQIPLGRLGEPQDVAELIAWLISPNASFISGTIIPVHGAR